MFLHKFLQINCRPKIPEPAAGPVPDVVEKAEPTGINININNDTY